MAKSPLKIGPREYFPAPSMWPFVVTLGIAITLPGLIANLSAEQQASLVIVGATIGSIGLIGWVVQDLLSLSPSFALATAAPKGPTRPYIPITKVVRSEARQTIYHRALQDIVISRFAFPSPQYPDYAVRVNDPHRSLGIQMPDGAVAYPNIVVVQHPENRTKIVAQVETKESVGEAAAHHEWLPYALLGPLYLYVPVGQGDEALALCRRFSVPIVGIRTWRYVVGYEEIEISDHFTVPAGPAELLPKILRPDSS